MTTMQTRIHDAIARLGYDFGRFTVPDFVGHLAARRQRPIVMTAMVMEGRELDGVWIRLDGADYVIYNAQTHAVHQTHIILHELGHIVLEHQGRPLSQALNAALGQPGDAPLTGRLYRGPAQDAEERAAECFARRVQQRVEGARRQRALAGPPSSLPGMARLARGLGYNE